MSSHPTSDLELSQDGCRQLELRDCALSPKFAYQAADHQTRRSSGGHWRHVDVPALVLFGRCCLGEFETTSFGKRASIAPSAQL